MGMKEKVRLITELNEDISAAVISYHKKDEMRGSLKTIKKKIDDEDRAKKAAVMGDVVEAAKAILTANPGLPYLVCELEAYASNKAIDGALKQVKLLAPETPTIFFSGDEDTGKILCMSYSSKAAISSGLKANDWCGSVQKLINGKGGGKPDNAQASGTNVSALSSAMETAHKFAMEKLGVAKTTVAVPASSGDAKPNPAAKSSGAAKSGAAVGGGSSAVSAPSGSAGSLLVQVAAKYAGQTVAAQSGDSFTFKSGELTLSSPVAASYFLNAANKTILGDTPALQGGVMQYLMYSENELRHLVAGWVNPTQSAVEGCNPGTVAKSKEALLKHLKALDTVMISRTYLVGERVSLADLVTCLTLLPAFKYVLDGTQRSSLRSLTRWFNTIINQEQVKLVVGSLELCAKEALVVAPKKEKAKKEKKEPEKKKPEKPKQEKEESEEAAPVEEKKKDPLDALPKGTFDLEDWKRFYSNNEEAASCEYFWKNFDSEHYSIWRGDYRYNDELTMIFMSCNLMGGMFQRLEKLKKNAFASAMLFGENNKSSISGIWVFKGQQLAFELSEDWMTDYASYEWKKLDAKDPGVVSLVNQYWKWEGADLDGRKFNQGKIFK